MHNLAVMFDALEELANLSLKLQRDNLNLTQAQSDITLLIKVFENHVDNLGKHDIVAKIEIGKTSRTYVLDLYLNEQKSRRFLKNNFTGD